jgi:hypothetical protein
MDDHHNIAKLEKQKPQGRFFQGECGFFLVSFSLCDDVYT